MSGGKDNTARLWYLEDDKGLSLAKFVGHNESVSCVAIAPKNRKFFVTASHDLTIKVWAITEELRNTD